MLFHGRNPKGEIAFSLEGEPEEILKEQYFGLFSVRSMTYSRLYLILSQFNDYIGLQRAAHYTTRHNQLILDIYDAVFKNKAT